MTQPITDTQLKELANNLLDLHNYLTKRVTYGHSLVAQNERLPYVETTLMENAQAHVREAAVAIGRIILNRVGDK